MKRWWIGLVLIVVLGAIGAAAIAGGSALYWSKSAPPEAATGWNEPQPEIRGQALVVAAHPLAAQAGAEILSRGGSAIDASVAVQAMLTLVEPQSSGLGGGAFALTYDHRLRALDAWDGRETAPAGATPEMFSTSTGEPMGFVEAMVGGRSVGVPGVVAMLAAMHHSGGRLPWAALFAPAIRAAEGGFEVTPRLHHLLRRDPLFRTMPAARALYFDGGSPIGVGERLANPELARVFHAVAREGPAGIYEGPVARAIVDAVKKARQPSSWKVVANTSWLGLGLPGDLGLMAAEANPGRLTLEDLRAYRAEQRAPLCVSYREWRVCGAPPPAGGVPVLQALMMLERFDFSGLGPRDPETIHLIAEVGRRAFADRNLYLADPAFVDVPTSGLLDPAYAQARSADIDPERATSAVSAGKPPGAQARARSASPERSSTSHFSIVDPQMNVVSMTTSVENVFGSRIVARGMVLNNQLTDFSFSPEREGAPVANAVAAGKRPRSSMSPVIVFDADGQPILVLGSPGGSRIIGYVLGVLVSVLEFGLSPDEAVRLPHALARGASVELEDRPWADGERARVVAALQAMGHEVDVVTCTSGLHVLKRDGLVWVPGVDPRREGRGVSP